MALLVQRNGLKFADGFGSQHGDDSSLARPNGEVAGLLGICFSVLAVAKQEADFISCVVLVLLRLRGPRNFGRWHIGVLPRRMHE